MRDQSGTANDGPDQLGRYLVTGAPVYAADGHKVGVVAEYQREWGYFCMRRGIILRRDAYVPLRAIARCDGGEVHLGLTRDGLGRLRLDQPPPYGEEPTATDLTAQRTAPAGTGQPAASPDAGAEVEEAGHAVQLDDPQRPDQGSQPPLL